MLKGSGKYKTQNNKTCLLKNKIGIETSKNNRYFAIKKHGIIVERYISQLIEDIHQARNSLKAPSHQWDFVCFENEGEIKHPTAHGQTKKIRTTYSLLNELVPLP